MVSAFDFFQTSGKKLSFSKMVELLRLPSPQREEILKENNVEEMSVREVRDKQIYKEKYSEFGDYVNSSGFKFSESHAYRMIQICEEFSRIDTTKYGITKCIALLSLPAPQREEILKENN